MKFSMKRLLCLLLALCLVGQWLPVSAQATLADVKPELSEIDEFEEILEVNPLYADVITEADLNRRSDREYSVNAVAESEYLTDFDEAVAVLREGLVAREPEIVVYFAMEEYRSTIFSEMFAAAREHTGNPKEGDTLDWGWGGMSYDFGGYTYIDMWYLPMIFTPTYYTTAQQEAELDAAVDALIATVDTTASDYEQIKTVYDYICANVTYDYDHDSEYTLKYTPYAAMINGTAVCQGYALLLYRLALELGIDARLIAGSSEGNGVQDHGWNIVKLNGKYYNADSTWDAGHTKYSWFLQSEANFTRNYTGHIRSEKYDTAEFHAAYPMSQTDYDPNAVPEEPDFIAEGICGDNLAWVLDKDGVLTISGEGEMWDFDGNIFLPWGEYGEEIRSVVIEPGVTSIGNIAFTFFPNLTTVTIPEGVTHIGMGAFGYVMNLTSVELPDSLVSMGDYAFAMTALTEINIPANVETIGVQALCCPNMTAIHVDADNSNYYSWEGMLYHVGHLAQVPCAMEGELVLPELTFSIYAYALSGCSKLTSVDIPAYATEIGQGAFTDCTALSEINFHGDLPAIAADAFDGIHATVTYPSANGYWTEAVKQNYGGTIQWQPFGENLVAYGFCGENNLQNNDLYRSSIAGENASWVLTSDGTMTISGEGRMIDCGFHGNHPWLQISNNDATRLTKVVVEEGITYFGSFSFMDFVGKNILELVLPSTLKEFGQGACYAMYALETVNISEGITELPDYVFGDCSMLASLDIPASVAVIGESALFGCTALTELRFHGDAPSIAADAFYGVTATVYYPANNPTWAADVMQDYGGTITWVPYSTATEIASGWSGYTQWVLTDDGVLTFYGNGNMKNYGYDGGQPWLAYADQITSVVIEEGVDAVGSGAFMGLTALENITLPETGLTKIGEAAFYGCTALKKIYIPDSIYTIWAYTFKGCTALESVRLPKTLIKIDQGAFENCTALDYVFIPSDVNIIGAWSFKGCTALKEADMQWADATEIREGAFKNCSALTKIHLPADIEILGDSCFYGIGATTFTVPATVNTVEAWCFARASVKSITFEGDAPAIGEGAFNKITLTAYYSGNNATWTAEIMQNYGGTITWKAK